MIFLFDRPHALRRAKALAESNPRLEFIYFAPTTAAFSIPITAFMPAEITS
jgi:hypothetical protein